MQHRYGTAKALMLPVQGWRGSWIGTPPYSNINELLRHPKAGLLTQDGQVAAKVATCVQGYTSRAGSCRLATSLVAAVAQALDQLLHQLAPGWHGAASTVVAMALMCFVWFRIACDAWNCSLRSVSSVPDALSN